MEETCPPEKSCKTDNEELDAKSNFDNSNMIINKMATLYAEKIMSDITLVVGNSEYPSHKLILCASSEVFQIMLHDSKWSEASEKRIQLGETPSCAAVFEDFLKYLYTGKIHLDYATVVPIVSLADKYNVKDLLKIGLDYMGRNVSTACKRNQVVSWFQLTLASGHNHVSNLCSNFIKANFQLVSKNVDFPHMEPDLLASLIRCNDLVIEDEFALFECVSRWLNANRSNMVTSGEDNVDLHFDRHVKLLIPHVRFPMMTPSQLANLLLDPLSKSHTEFLVDRIRAGVRYHQGEEVPPRQATRPEEARLYTPRLYTKEKFCASLSIDHFYELPFYHSRSLLFASQRHISSAAHLDSGLDIQDQLDWSVDVYPKGVFFQRCITVYLPSGKELPERVLKTVRVSITNKRVEEDIFVKIGILIIGDQDDFEHVRCVKSRNYIFTPMDQIVNFDDIVDYDELIAMLPKSNFLSGEAKDSFKILVTITPLTKHVSSLEVS